MNDFLRSNVPYRGAGFSGFGPLLAIVTGCFRGSQLHMLLLKQLINSSGVSKPLLWRKSWSSVND
jgi:hypothetical protein